MCEGLRMSKIGENEKGAVFHGKRFFELYKTSDEVRGGIIGSFIKNREK